MSLQNGRLWAVRRTAGEPVFYDTDQDMPLLFGNLRRASHFADDMRRLAGTTAEIIEVKIVEKKNGGKN